MRGIINGNIQTASLHYTSVLSFILFFSLSLVLWSFARACLHVPTRFSQQNQSLSTKLEFVISMRGKWSVCVCVWVSAFVCAYSLHASRWTVWWQVCMLFMLLHFNASQLSPDRFWEVLTCDVQHDDWICVCVCVGVKMGANKQLWCCFSGLVEKESLFIGPFDIIVASCTVFTLKTF